MPSLNETVSDVSCAEVEQYSRMTHVSSNPLRALHIQRPVVDNVQLRRDVIKLYAI